MDRLSETEKGSALGILRKAITENTETLVDSFYGSFLAHPRTAEFLDHDIVQQRLRHSLAKWLVDLLNLDDIGTTEYRQRQVKIGEIHARINLPVYFVLEGASLLKVEIARIFSGYTDVDAQVRIAAVMMLDEIIDLAMRLMSAAYVTGTRRRAHADEDLRLFSIGQDLSSERERQRAGLMEWCQEILFSLATQSGVRTLEPLSLSPFGLWLRHRAGLLFQSSDVLQSIKQTMERIDRDILPAIERSGNTEQTERVKNIGQLQSAIDEIKFLLANLFEAAAELESGRDPLTQVLNRKFLPPILGREIALARRNKLALSVVLIDVDHFKQINGGYGHAAGDAVLRQVAESLMNIAQASDFVFRYGGEEFLIVLVETGLEEALVAAERFRAYFESRTVMLPDDTSIRITISAGAATYEGHPDYEYLINAADEALLTAKRNGRNRVEAAVQR